MQYFDEKPKVKKRQPHKRKDKKVLKSASARTIFEQFLEYKQKQNLRPSTLNQHIATFKNAENFHATKTEKPLFLNDMNTDFFNDYVYWMKHEAVKFEGHKYKPESAQVKGLSDASIEGRIKYIKSFINWCVKKGHIKQNPFDNFEGFKKEKHTIDILTRNEINSLLKVAKSYSNKSFKHFRDNVLLHLLVDGMLRISEALTLSPSNIDHVNRTIIIQAEHAKSRKARIIPLSNKTYRLLTTLLVENEAFEGEVDDLLFLSLSGRILNKNNILRDFKKYALEANINKRFYLHLIRHSVATHFLESGDVESLRQILGHSDLRTVLMYSHMADKTIQDKHAKSGFFGSDNMITRKRDNKRK
ncbi:tyrosine-type recombinase/integrase [Alkalihalobacillus sp. R86527]|uniref:tyrosine-type recombinase/integrase n=1 Tax=Alkalihalobacillus sp. R86527 TaxID=3093863 RepID=UPI00366C44EE